MALATVPITLGGCRDRVRDSVVQEAASAEREGRIINNEAMLSMYSYSFRPGNPPYLERDFEAGADFICNEIMRKRGKDFCAEAGINWRR